QFLSVRRRSTTRKLVHGIGIVFADDINAVDEALVSAVHQHQAAIKRGIRTTCTQELLPRGIQVGPAVPLYHRRFIGEERDVPFLQILEHASSQTVASFIDTIVTYVVSN